MNDQRIGEAIPVAKWEGEIMGIRVAVLEDGTRIINVEDLPKIFEPTFALTKFLVEYGHFMNDRPSDSGSPRHHREKS